MIHLVIPGADRVKVDESVNDGLVKRHRHTQNLRSSESRLGRGGDPARDSFTFHFSNSKLYKGVPVLFVEIIFVEIGNDAFWRVLEIINARCVSAVILITLLKTWGRTAASSFLVSGRTIFDASKGM